MRARFSSLIGRRKWLLGAGSALALPYLPSLVGESRAAGEPTFAKRFLFFFSANGQQPAVWHPADPPAWTQRGTFVRDAPLADYAGKGGLSAACGPELDPLLPKLALIRGLDFVNTKAGGHRAATPLSGSLVNPFVTLDQILAYSPKVYPTAPAVRSIHALVKYDYQAETSCSVDASLQDVPHQTSVAAIYQRLFGDFVPPDDAGAQERATKKLDLLARLEETYGAVSKHERLGSEDKKRLEDHRDFLADLRSRLGVVGAACDKPGAPTDAPLDSEEALDQAAQTISSLITAAFLCDRTRVATLMLCPGTDLRLSHHDLSHAAPYDQGAIPQLAAINRHYAAQVAKILGDLDSLVEDPVTGTTYLDNTLAYWGNEDGCNGFDAHVPYNAPVLLAGATRHFEMGRYIDYRQVNPDGSGNCVYYSYEGNPTCEPTDYRGRPYNSLLVSIAQAMGLEAADYEQGGQAGIGDLSGNVFDQWDLASATQPLPLLASA
jgi:hypothetical protein